LSAPAKHLFSSADALFRDEVDDRRRAQEALNAYSKPLAAPVRWLLKWTTPSARQN